MRKICGSKNSKTLTDRKILPLSFNTKYFKLLYAAFLFWPSIYTHVQGKRTTHKNDYIFLTTLHFNLQLRLIVL